VTKPAASLADLEALRAHLQKTMLPVKQRLATQLAQTKAAALHKARAPPASAAANAAAGSPPRRAVARSRSTSRPRGGDSPCVLIDDEEDAALGCIQYLEQDGDGDLFPAAHATGGGRRKRRRTHGRVVTDSGSDRARSSSDDDDPRYGGLGPPAGDLAHDAGACARVQVLPEVVEYQCSVCTNASGRAASPSFFRPTDRLAAPQVRVVGDARRQPVVDPRAPHVPQVRPAPVPVDRHLARRERDHARGRVSLATRRVGGPPLDTA